MSEEFVSITKAEYQKLLADSKAIAESRKTKKKNTNKRIANLQYAIQYNSNEYQKLQDLDPSAHFEKIVNLYGDYDQASSKKVISICGTSYDRLLVTGDLFNVKEPIGNLVTLFTLSTDKACENYNSIIFYFYDEQAVKLIRDTRLQSSKEAIDSYTKELEQLVAEQEYVR